MEFIDEKRKPNISCIDNDADKKSREKFIAHACLTTTSLP